VVTKPRFTYGCCFVDDLWVDSNFVLLDYFSPIEELSLMIFESIGAVYAAESTRHLWKLFHWWFLSQQRLSFRWLFLSQQGLFALSKPHITFESYFIDVFGVCKDSVFVDYFWVARDFVHWRIHASPVEAVSLTISESTGVVCDGESMPHLWKQFRWWFLSLQQLSFR